MFVNTFLHPYAISGSLSHLTKYESSRQRKVIPVAATIDGLQKLYGTDFTPVVLLRTLGLQATNALSFVKVNNLDLTTPKVNVSEL